MLTKQNLVDLCSDTPSYGICFLFRGFHQSRPGSAEQLLEETFLSFRFTFVILFSQLFFKSVRNKVSDLDLVVYDPVDAAPVEHSPQVSVVDKNVRLQFP